MFGEWFCQNWYANCFTIATVVASGLISWVISAIYYRIGNRNNLKSSVIFPVVELLKEPYSEINYKALCKISDEYSMRYMNKREQKAFNDLQSAYRDIRSYHENSVNAGILYEYFEYELAKNNIKWKSIPVYINDELVDYEPPEGWFSLPDDIEKIFNRYELEFEVDECENALKNLYIAYCKNYFSIQEISFFEEKKITKIIEESEITKEWNQRFQNLNNKKKEFLILKVARSTLRSDPCAQQRALH